MASAAFLILSSFGESSNSSDANRIAQLEDSITRLNIQLNVALRIARLEDSIAHLNTQLNAALAKLADQNESDAIYTKITGTYKFTDALNQQWTLTLNNDNSATLVKGSSESIIYGSWDEYGEKNPVSIDFEAAIAFPNKIRGLFAGRGYLKNGYLYPKLDAARAKDPNKRLAIKKIE